MPDQSHNQSSQRVDATLFLHPQTLARLGTFELRAKTIVEGVMSGMHRSPYQGVSVEFAQHRAYSPGDDIRHLDWKVYGRTDRLHLKQYQQETNLDLTLLVDVSGSMNFGTCSFAAASGAGRTTSPDGRVYWSKFDHATAVAAAMAYVTLKQRDRVGMMTYADDVVTIVNRSNQQAAWRQIVAALSGSAVDRKSDIRRSVERALAKFTNRALVVIISDFFEDMDAIRAAIARIRHRGHDAALFQVVDPAEIEFDPARLGHSASASGVTMFEGLEGEPRLRLDPRAIRESYRQAFGAHNAELDRLARASGFDYHQFVTGDWLGPALAAFIARRNAQLKRMKYG